MSNRDCRSADCCILQCILYQFLGIGVKRCSGFVKQDDPRIFKQRTRDSDLAIVRLTAQDNASTYSLFLATRQSQSPFTDFSVVAFRELHYAIMYTCSSACILNIL